LNIVVSFPRTIKATRDIAGVSSIVKLTDEELKGYEWVKAHGEVSAKDYATHFNITPRTASRHLATMLKFKLVRTNGENLKSPKLRYITV
jgi:predicted HTH transcriptional regulator